MKHLFLSIATSAALLLLVACGSSGGGGGDSGNPGETITINSGYRGASVITTGDNDDEIYFRNGAADAVERVFTGGGADDVSIERGTWGSSTAPAELWLGAGEDLVSITGGTLWGDIYGGAGADRVSITSGALNGNIYLGAGGRFATDSDIRHAYNEVVLGARDDGGNLTGDGTLTGNIFGGEDRDDFYFYSGTFTGYADLGGGEDRMRIFSGSFTGYHGGTTNTATGDCAENAGVPINGCLYGGTGDDVFILDGGTITTITGDANGEDIIHLRSGTITNGISLGDGGSQVYVGYTETVTDDQGNTTTNYEGTISLAGGIAGAGGDDEINFYATAEGGFTGGIDARGGNDEINFYGDYSIAENGQVDAGAGDDDLSVLDGTFTGDLGGGAGDDNLMLSGGEIVGHIRGGAGFDRIALFDGTLNDGDVRLGGGRSDEEDPRYEANLFFLGSLSAGTYDGGATLNGNVLGGNVEDEIFFYQGTLGDGEGNIDAGNGDDVIEIHTGEFDGYSGGALSGAFPSGERNIYGGAGADTFILDGGNDAQMNGNIIGADDDIDDGDEETLDGDRFIFINGRDDVFDTTQYHVDAGAGNDEIEVGEAFVFSAYSGAAPSTAQPGMLYGGGGEDTFTLDGGQITGNIIGADTETDTIILTSGVLGVFNDADEYQSGGNVNGAGGDDEITLALDGFADYFGGALSGAFPSTERNIYGGAGADTFTLDGAALGSILGEDASNVQDVGGEMVDTSRDIVEYNSGSITGNVELQNGNDELTLFHDDIGGYVDMGAGNDIITLTEGCYASYEGAAKANSDEGRREVQCLTDVAAEDRPVLYGGAGDNEFRLEGGTIGGDINGASSASVIDTIMLTSGRVRGEVNLNDGDDVFHLGDAEDGRAFVAGGVYGGDGEDEFYLYDGGLAFVDGGDGNDEFYIYSRGIDFSGDCDDDDSNEEQWICGGSGNDTIIYDEDIDPFDSGEEDDPVVGVETEECVDDGSQGACPTTSSIAGIERVALSPRLALHESLIPAMQDLAHELMQPFSGEAVVPSAGVAHLFSSSTKTTGAVAVRERKIQKQMTSQLKLGAAKGNITYDQTMTLSQQRFGATLSKGLSMHGGVHIAQGELGSASLAMGLETYGAQAGLLYRNNALTLGVDMLAAQFLFSPEQAGYAGASNFSGQQMSIALHVAQTFRWLEPQAQLVWHETALPTQSVRGLTAQAGLGLTLGSHQAKLLLHHATSEMQGVGSMIEHHPGGTALALDWQGNFITANDFTLTGSAGWRHDLTADKPDDAYGALMMQWKF